MKLKVVRNFLLAFGVSLSMVVPSVSYAAEADAASVLQTAAENDEGGGDTTYEEAADAASSDDGASEDTTSDSASSGDTASADTTSGSTTSGDTASEDTTSGSTSSGDTVSSDAAAEETTSEDYVSEEAISVEAISDSTSSDSTSSDSTSSDSASSDSASSGSTSSGDTGSSSAYSGGSDSDGTGSTGEAVQYSSGVVQNTYTTNLRQGFERIDKVYAIAYVDDYLCVRESASTSARVVGELSPYALCYIITDEDNNDEDTADGDNTDVSSADAANTDGDNADANSADAANTDGDNADANSADAANTDGDTADAANTDGDEEWIYIESDDVRGFVKAEYLVTGVEAEMYVELTGEDMMDTATTVVDPEENEAFDYIKKTVYDTTTTVSSVKGEEIVAYAEQFVGNPYVWGGNSLTSGIDCSHFVWQVLTNCGVYDGGYYTSYGWRFLGEEVAGLEEAQAGDIICYEGHVAIYDGNGKIVEAQGRKAGITHSRAADCREIITIRRFIATADTVSIDGYETEYLGNFRLTGYCPCVICCGKWANGITASGVTAVAGRTVAIAASTMQKLGLEFGDQIYLRGHIYTVEDHGGTWMAVTNDGLCVDIYCNTHSECYSSEYNGYDDVYKIIK